MFNLLILYIDHILHYQDGYSPEISIKIGGDSLQTSTWSQLIQVLSSHSPFSSLDFFLQNFCLLDSFNSLMLFQFENYHS